MDIIFNRNKIVNKVVLLETEKIIPNANQPRKLFDEEKIRELAESIRENGLLQPIIVVKKHDNTYELIAGERRLSAFKVLGEKHIPAIIETIDEEKSAILALVENLQRVDLNFFEQAYAINKLVKEYGISQKEVAVKLGKQQSTVANKLRLLKLSLRVKQLIIENSLTERHARSLLKMEEDEQRLACLSYVIKHKLNVEQTENYIQNLLLKDQPKSAKKILVVKDVRVFMNTVNKAVQIMKYAGLSIDTDKTEDENYINYIVKIPKVQAYQQVNCH